MGDQEKISRRTFLKGIAALGATGAVSVLAGCNPQEASQSPSPSPETPSALPPEPTQEPTPLPTETPEPTPVIAEGATIIGETLNIGGAELELLQMPAEELADLVGAHEKGWKIVSSEDGTVHCFIGFDDKTNEALAILGQGPAGHTWNSEVGVWESQNNPSQGVIPDVVIPGSWSEEKQSAGPLYSPQFAFMYQDQNGQYHTGVLYSSETMAVFKAYLEAQGVAPENLEQELKAREIEILANGQGLWLRGLAKNYTLSDNQKAITRDPETGSLVILDNADRHYLVMLTRWSAVKSSRQAEYIGKFEEAILVEGITYLAETEFGEVPVTLGGDKFVLKTENGPQELPFVFTDPENGPEVLIKHFLMAVAENPEIKKHYKGLNIPWENEQDVRNYLVQHQGKLDYFVCPTGNPNDPNIPPAELDYLRDETGKIQVSTLDLINGGIILNFQPYTGIGSDGRGIKIARGESGDFGGELLLINDEKLIITLFNAEEKQKDITKLFRIGDLSGLMVNALRALAYPDSHKEKINEKCPAQGGEEIGCSGDFGLVYVGEDGIGYWSYVMFLPKGIKLPLPMWGD